MSQKDASLWGTFAICVAGAVLAFGALVLLNAFLSVVRIEALAEFAVPLVATLVIATLLALVMLVTIVFVGSQHAYLFAGGLVVKSRRFVDAAPWRQLEQLTVDGSGYRLNTFDGRGFKIDAPHGKPDPFGDRLLAVARELGLPILDPNSPERRAARQQANPTDVQDPLAKFFSTRKP